MSVLNRSFLTPQNAGFEYEDYLSGTLVTTASIQGNLIQFFLGSLVIQGTATAETYPALQSTAIISSSLEGELVDFFAATALAEVDVDGRLDGEVFSTIANLSASVPSVAIALVTDMSGTLLAAVQSSGEILDHLSAEISISATTSGYLASLLQSTCVVSVTAQGSLVETFKGAVAISTSISGGIDIPDYISAEATINAFVSGEMFVGFSGRLSSSTATTGQLTLTQASDLAGVCAVVGSLVSEDMFLQTATDLAGVLNQQITLSGVLTTPTSKLRRLGNIKLVHSVRR